MARLSKPAKLKSGLSKKNSTENNRELLAKHIVQNFRVIVKTIQAHSRWVEKQSGVSAVQLWALWELFAAPGLKVSELSKALSVHQSTASNMLDKLEQKHLIRRDRTGPDQRVVHLYLTQKGIDLLSQAPRPAQGAVQDALKRMSDNELNNLGEGLDTLIAYMALSEEGAELEPI